MTAPTTPTPTPTPALRTTTPTTEAEREALRTRTRTSATGTLITVEHLARLLDDVDSSTAEAEHIRAEVERLTRENETLRTTLSCPNSDYGTHRCIRCDSEVTP